MLLVFSRIYFFLSTRVVKKKTTKFVQREMCTTSLAAKTAPRELTKERIIVTYNHLI